MSNKRPVDQLSLLDWEPPQPVVRFADDRVRAVSVADRLARGVAEALKDCLHSREEVAARMSAYLGQNVSVPMLNAYASQAREGHVMNIPRFVALLHATQDRRLLELFAEMFGWTVIERRFLKLIELASIQDREDELRRQRQSLQRQAKSEGMLG